MTSYAYAKVSPWAQNQASKLSSCLSANNFISFWANARFGLELVMKVLSSLKSAKARHRDCKIVRRRGKVFVICKSNPRFKARQR